MSIEELQAQYLDLRKQTRELHSRMIAARVDLVRAYLQTNYPGVPLQVEAYGDMFIVSCSAYNARPINVSKIRDEAYDYVLSISNETLLMS